MKASATYVLTALLSAAHVYAAECVEGTRQEISPDYVVVHKCGFYRKGETYKKIDSEADCAMLAKNAGASASSYHPGRKQCIVAADGEMDKPYPGVTLLVKVEEEAEDPFAEDPFPADSEDEKADCLEREEKLKEELLISQSQATDGQKDSALLKDNLASNCPSQHGKEGLIEGVKYKFWCTRYHSAANPKETTTATTMAECVKLCTARSWCTYVLHGTYKTSCQLYAHKQASTTSTPLIHDAKWNCAVKV